MPAGHGTLRSVDSEAELRLRQMIVDRLAEIVAEHGDVTRSELESLRVGAETRRIIDRNRGIWNPKGVRTRSQSTSARSGVRFRTVAIKRSLGTDDLENCLRRGWAGSNPRPTDYEFPFDA
jgi:hypothetical protein